MSSKSIHRDLPRSPGVRLRTWASTRFVELFDELEQFASDDRAAVTGMQTNDNGRWARLLWEGEASRGGLQLVPFAKGGSHSPYYFETYIGLRWGADGRALKEWKLDELSRGRITANNSRCWNEQYYFRPDRVADAVAEIRASALAGGLHILNSRLIGISSRTNAVADFGDF